MALRTNYKDDVYNGKRKYQKIDNRDGTYSLVDVTEYIQVGDTYGSAQMNEKNDLINNLDAKCYKETDAVETSIVDSDYIPFYDSSTSAKRRTTWSNLKTVLTGTFAIRTHSSSANTYGLGNASLFGHIKLSDVFKTSAGAAAAAIGASSKAIFDCYTAIRTIFNSTNQTLSSLSNRVSVMNTQVTTNKNDLTSLKTRMTNLESKNTSGSTKITKLERELTANDNRIYMDYHDGKYGFNTSSNRDINTFIPF